MSKDMRILQSIFVFIFLAAGSGVALVIDKYIKDLFPDEATLGVWIFFAICIFFLIATPIYKIWVSKSKKKPRPNWNIWQTVYFLQKWAGYKLDRVPQLIIDVRQKATLGEITVWAKLGLTAPLDIVPKAEFREFTFDVRSVFRCDANAILPPQYEPKIYETGHIHNFFAEKIYYEPYFSSVEIKRIFPRKWHRFYKKSSVVKPLIPEKEG